MRMKSKLSRILFYAMKAILFGFASIPWMFVMSANIYFAGNVLKQSWWKIGLKEGISVQEPRIMMIMIQGVITHLLLICKFITAMVTSRKVTSKGKQRKRILTILQIVRDVKSQFVTSTFRKKWLLCKYLGKIIIQRENS